MSGDVFARRPRGGRFFSRKYRPYPQYLPPTLGGVSPEKGRLNGFIVMATVIVAVEPTASTIGRYESLSRFVGALGRWAVN